MNKIIELDIKNFEKYNNIWNMDKNKEHKDKIYNELLNKIKKLLLMLKTKNI